MSICALSLSLSGVNVRFEGRCIDSEKVLKHTGVWGLGLGGYDDKEG